MSEQPNQPVAASHPVLDEERRAILSEALPDLPETLALAEETFHVSKRAVVTGIVRVSTRTEVTETIADITLDRTVAEVTRVPIGRLVEEPPAMRTEGEVTIVPVFEERYVVVKQLYLTEELHIRHRSHPVVSHTPVQVRRQTAIIERLDAKDRLGPDDRQPEPTRATGAF